MNRLVLYRYLVRMVVFVSIWVLGFWLVDNSPPMQKLPWGILAWLLSELLMKVWSGYMKDKKTGS